MTEKVTNTAAPCETCPIHNAAALKKLGVDMTDFDYVVALSGNPNQIPAKALSSTHSPDCANIPAIGLAKL